MKKFLFSTSMVVVCIFIFACKKDSTNNCEKNNTGTVMLHNDGTYMPSGTADFYLGATKIASVAKGSTATVDNISVGAFKVTVKIGNDTIYRDIYNPDTVRQCEELHYHTSVYLPVSDRRLKKNIAPYQNALENIGKLSVYTYAYQTPNNYKGFLPNGMHYGFMAQELKEVYPNFVQIGSNGYYSVNYQELIPVLIKGIQEQQAQIEELKQALADLKKSIQTTTLAAK